ncbi:hypothetical protein BC828DRAFT_284696 [Blastocladiella britannica]|nr:hypothetical protein BC828DRAFT_284696 [Blastocladiella britannica]
MSFPNAKPAATGGRLGTCPHLAREIARDPGFTSRARAVARYGEMTREGRPSELPPSHATSAPTRQQWPPECRSCTYYRRLSVCLTCMACYCFKEGHMRVHLSQSNHGFAWDIEHGAVYCRTCNDYIYDTLFGFNEAEIEPEYEPFLRRPPKCGGLRGIRNLGATCYLSVVVQALVHNPHLSDFFLREEHSALTCTNMDPCVACDVDSVYSEIYSGATLPITPTDLLFGLWSARKEIAAGGQQDAHEAFIALVNAVHTGLTGGELSPTGAVGGGGSVHRPQCACAIHATFGGVLQSTLTCPQNHETTADDPFLDISLDLRASAAEMSHTTWQGKGSAMENAYRRQNAVAGGAMDRSGSVKLTDCLRKFTSFEQISYRCEECQAEVSGKKRLSIKTLPRSLCLQFKRSDSIGTDANKKDTTVAIPSSLNLTKFMCDRRARTNPEHTYNLYAVVHHNGKTANAGHYYVYVMHRGHWFKLDDGDVSSSSEQEATGPNAYMCYYTLPRSRSP